MYRIDNRYSWPNPTVSLKQLMSNDYKKDRRILTHSTANVSFCSSVA